MMSELERSRVHFRFVASYFKETGYKDETVSEEYMVHVTYAKPRHRLAKAEMWMENVATGAVLRAPADREMMELILPSDFWPEFVKDLIFGQSDNQNQPELFPAERLT